MPVKWTQPAYPDESVLVSASRDSDGSGWKRTDFEFLKKWEPIVWARSLGMSWRISVWGQFWNLTSEFPCPASCKTEWNIAKFQRKTKLSSVIYLPLRPWLDIWRCVRFYCLRRLVFHQPPWRSLSTVVRPPIWPPVFLGLPASFVVVRQPAGSSGRPTLRDWAAGPTVGPKPGSFQDARRAALYWPVKCNLSS